MKKYRLYWFIACLILIPSFSIQNTETSFAAGSNFFEYAPDAWQSKRYLVSSGATPYQLFSAPENFEMTGLDIWLDNTAGSGLLTVTLSDEGGNDVASRTMTIPTIPSFPGGIKRHIDWPTPVFLTAGKTYALELYSNMPELGIYYADRISLIEHNREYSVPYALGAARIGSVLQNFTFKFALYKTETSLVNANTEEEVIIETAPQEIAISNARVVETTSQAALFAWTTNIAADSKVAIRTQLNPLYVMASATDSTLELEHTLWVTGLNPNINYFADVFSSTGEVLTLTTYTISFKTQSKEATEIVSSVPETPNSPTTPVQNPSVNSNQPAAPTNNNQGAGTQTTSSQASSSQNTTNTGAPQISVTPSGGDSASFEWEPSSSEEPSNGYRIDVFNHAYQLKQQIILPAGTHTQEIDNLTKGVNRVVIYEASEDGTFTKVAPAKEFVFTGSSNKTINSIFIISAVWIVSLGGWIYMKARKSKRNLVKA